MSQPTMDVEESGEERREEVLENLQDDEVPNKHVDALITLGFLAGAIGFLFLSGNFASATSSTYDPGAAFWPRITLTVVVIAAVVNVTHVLRRLYRSDRDVIPALESVTSTVEEAASDYSKQQKQFLLASVAILVYLAALTPTGFLFATPFFLLAFAWVAGYRDLGKLFLFSICTTLFLFLGFRIILNISLPYGNGIFRDLSLFFEIFFNNLLS